MACTIHCQMDVLTGVTGKPTCSRPLILCPSSLVMNWGNELKRWLGLEHVDPVAMDDTRGAVVQVRAWFQAHLGRFRKILSFLNLVKAFEAKPLSKTITFGHCHGRGVCAYTCSTAVQERFKKVHAPSGLHTKSIVFERLLGLFVAKGSMPFMLGVAVWLVRPHVCTSALLHTRAHTHMLSLQMFMCRPWGSRKVISKVRRGCRRRVKKHGRHTCTEGACS